MAKPPFNASSVTRAQALAALDEPENHQALAKQIFDQMRAYGTKLQGAKRVKLIARNALEEVAAEALVKAVAESEYDDDAKPPAIEIIRRDG